MTCTFERLSTELYVFLNDVVPTVSQDSISFADTAIINRDSDQNVSSTIQLLQTAPTHPKLT